MKQIVFFGFLISLIACNSVKQITQQETFTPMTVPTDAPHILSTIVNLEYIDGKLNLVDHQFILKEGYLKPGTVNQVKSENSLYCTFTNASKEIISAQWIENPIHGRLESVDENGKLITIQNPSDQGTILIRTNFENGMQRLNIFTPSQNDSLHLLQSLVIQEHKEHE